MNDFNKDEFTEEVARRDIVADEIAKDIGNDPKVKCSDMPASTAANITDDNIRAVVSHGRDALIPSVGPGSAEDWAEHTERLNQARHDVELKTYSGSSHKHSEEGGDSEAENQEESAVATSNETGSHAFGRTVDEHQKEVNEGKHEKALTFMQNLSAGLAMTNLTGIKASDILGIPAGELTPSAMRAIGFTPDRGNYFSFPKSKPNS